MKNSLVVVLSVSYFPLETKRYGLAISLGFRIPVGFLYGNGDLEIREFTRYANYTTSVSKIIQFVCYSTEKLRWRSSPNQVYSGSSL